MNSKTSNPISFHSLNEDGYDGSMTNLFEREGWYHTALDLADIIVFNGGTDIGTEIYGESPVARGIPAVKSKRDKYEVSVYETYMDSPKLKLGICRGAQLLNCLNGGSLWQDVSNHGRSHQMTVLATGQKLHVTSTHHQMMRPNYQAGVILAIANEAKHKIAHGAQYPNGIQTYPDDHKDTEVVYYPNTHSLCIQGHPEYVPGSAFAAYCIDLVVQYLKEAQSVAA